MVDRVWMYGNAADKRTARLELLAIQDRRCAGCFIAANDPAAKHLVVDHDHDTGWVRGLLCWTCNQQEARAVPDWAAYVAEPPATMTRERCADSFRTRVEVHHERARADLQRLWLSLHEDYIKCEVIRRQEEAAQAFRKSPEYSEVGILARRMADSMQVGLTYDREGDLPEVNVENVIASLRRHLVSELSMDMIRERIYQVEAFISAEAEPAIRAATVITEPHRWVSARQAGDEPVSEPACGHPNCSLGWYAHEQNPDFRAAFDRVVYTRHRLEEILNLDAA